MIPALKIGSLKPITPLLLAPLAGYTDTAFRLSIREQGGLGLAITEMINPRSVIHGGGRKRDALLAREPDDQPLGWQLYGSDPKWLADGARFLIEHYQAELIDINMGCPQRKIASRGEGAALLKDPAQACRIATAVVEAARPVPVTVKIRIGWDAQRPVAPALAAALAACGVSAVTIHGRTGVQKYTGNADRQAIREVVEAAAGIPVIANGDIITPQDAKTMFETTGCAGIMIGRGALRNPWIFKQTMEYLTDGKVSTQVTPSLRRTFLLKHLDRISTLYGADNAVKLFRKWIPQHAAALGINKPEMVRIMQLGDEDELRACLDQQMFSRVRTGSSKYEASKVGDY